MPLLLLRVVNVDDDVWRLLLLLREIVELVCAPQTSRSQIMYLNRLVKLYVEERVHLSPNSPVRPNQHHYLLHYPWLILQFGSLIHVWTMRMESKHSFFKRCVRITHNFINVIKTSSETHQLNQAFLSTGPLVYDGANPQKSAPCYMHHYNDPKQLLLRALSMSRTCMSSSVLLIQCPFLAKYCYVHQIEQQAVAQQFQL